MIKYMSGEDPVGGAEDETREEPGFGRETNSASEVAEEINSFLESLDPRIEEIQSGVSGNREKLNSVENTAERTNEQVRGISNMISDNREQMLQALDEMPRTVTEEFAKYLTGEAVSTDYAESTVSQDFVMAQNRKEVNAMLEAFSEGKGDPAASIIAKRSASAANRRAETMDQEEPYTGPGDLDQVDRDFNEDYKQVEDTVDSGVEAVNYLRDLDLVGDNPGIMDAVLNYAQENGIDLGEMRRAEYKQVVQDVEGVGPVTAERFAQQMAPVYQD
ncbi:MAG: hypothetical protein ABEI07_02790 [Candidatus Nanohaloarchaea archaeon]